MTLILDREPLFHGAAGCVLTSQAPDTRHHVPARIAEACGDFGCIRPDGLYDLAAVRLNRLDRLLDTIHHDVEEQSRRARRRASAYEGATHFSCGIVKRSCAVTTLSHVPSEYVLVELRGTRNISCG